MKIALVVFLQSNMLLHELDHLSHKDGCEELRKLLEADSINSVTVVSTHPTEVFGSALAPQFEKGGIFDKLVGQFSETLQKKFVRYPSSVGDKGLQCPGDDVIRPIADFATGSGAEQVLIVLPGKRVPDSAEVNHCSEIMVNELHTNVLMLTPEVYIDFV